MCHRVEQRAACAGQRLGPIAGLAQIVRAFLDGALQFDPVVFLGLAGLRALDDTAELFTERRGELQKVGILGLGYGTEELQDRNQHRLHHHAEGEDTPLGQQRFAGVDHVLGLVLPPWSGDHHPSGHAHAGPEAGRHSCRPYLPEERVFRLTHPQATGDENTRVVTGGDEQMADVPLVLLDQHRHHLGEGGLVVGS